MAAPRFRCAGWSVRIAGPDGQLDLPRVERLTRDIASTRGAVAADAFRRSVREYRAIGCDVARLGCGAPLDELIESLPSDGVERTVLCPVCGNPFTTFRAPEVKEG